MIAEPGGEGVGQKPVVKFPKLLPLQWRPAPQHPEQRGIGRRTPPQHDPLKPRDLFRQGAQMLSVKQVAVIADREGTAPEGPGEGLLIRQALIHARPVPGVDDQLRQGIALVYLQNGGKLLRAVQTHAGLDGDFDRRFVEHPAEKGVQRGRIRQHPRALVLGDHRARGAARVQVDLFIAQLLQLPGHRQKGLRAVGKDLGHQAYPLIVVRQDVPQVLQSEIALTVRGDEGGVIAVRAGKHGAVYSAVSGAGNALHGRKTEKHG